MNETIVLLTDSYKVSHWKQYPPNTTNVYSYYESRGGRFDHTVFFGLQYILDTYLSKPVTHVDVTQAALLYRDHFGTDSLFNEEGWRHIVDEHDGYLPVRIRAVPEGLRIPNLNVLMTAENTDPACFWLTNFLETLLCQVWYPSTVATLSHEARRLITEYLERTGDPSLVDFKLHDFGFRGVSSVESAGIGGGAHLINFLGTDTVAAMTFLERHYGPVEGSAGFSVPAAEHSTITSWGREHELDAYRNMIEQYGDQPFYSVVSDSYDIFRAAEEMWGMTLHDEVLDADGTLVVRPDSGHPQSVILRLLEILGERFGYEPNEKGYKVLNPKVRIIQGDGLDFEMIEKILFAMATKNWSADNLAFGMGGGLLQQVNRDTQKFAFKCSSVIVDGEERDVYKLPVTDSGKRSKRGRLGLYLEDGRYATREEGLAGDLLVPVFENGEILKRYTLGEVRENVRASSLVAA